MKNFLIPLLAYFIFSITSCKKNDIPPVNENEFRLTSAKTSWYYNYSQEETYLYSNNRLMQYELEEENGAYNRTNYTYKDDFVIGITYFYSQSDLYHIDSLIYYFENEKFDSRERWAKMDSNWVFINLIEFVYSGDDIIAYYDTLGRDLELTEYQIKGTFSYDADGLKEYNYYSRNLNSGIWSTALTILYEYENNKMTERIIRKDSPYSNDIKYAFNYSGGIHSTTDIYLDKHEEWIPVFHDTCSYDQNDNLIMLEHIKVEDQSMHSIIEYKYEKGTSNMKSVQYRGWPYDGLHYPDLFVD